MSITEQHTQELLNRAYVLAVAAKAGLKIAMSSELDYSIDVMVDDVTEIIDAAGRKSLIELGVTLKMQLKATTKYRMSTTHIHYYCEGEAYNKVVIQNSRAANPVILVVFCQPKMRSEWLNVSEDALTLRKACYWYYLTGSQTAQTSKVIHIPRSQLLTPDELNGIMSRINGGGIP